MTYRRQLLCSAAFAAGLLGAPVAASAATFFTPVQTDTHTFLSLSGTTSLSFTGFTASLGTLTSVEMTLVETAAVHDTALVFPVGSGAQSVGNPIPLTATATTTVTGTGGLFASGTVTTPGFVGIVLDNGVTNVVGSITSTGTGSATLISPPTDLTRYIGGVNSVSLTLTETGTQGGSVPAAVHSGTSGSAAVTVTLQYNYTTSSASVPEPASLALLGVGMLGLGVVRRRRKG
jgi:hypothetical protein